MATIGTLAVNITANTSSFVKGIAKVRSTLKPFTNLGLGITAAVAGMVKQFESSGSELHDLAEATGINVEQLSFLKYAAEQSGTSLEALTAAARELQSRGINPDQFEAIAASLAKIKDPVECAQAAFAKFGKRAGFPILKMLKDIPALKQRFKELGGGFSKEMADRADNTGDAFGNLKLAVMSVANAVAFTLAPVIIATTEYIANQVALLRDWISAHPILTKAIAGTAFALATMIPVLYGIEKAMKAVAVATALMQIARAHPYAALAVGGALAALGAYQYFKGGAAPEQTPITLPGINMPTVNGIPGAAQGFGPSVPGASQPKTMDEKIHGVLKDIFGEIKRSKDWEPEPIRPRGPDGPVVQLAIGGIR